MTFELIKDDPIKKRVLIVEDNFTHRQLMGEFFGRYESFTLDFAGNGVEAIQAVINAREAGESYNLIMMDMVMPVMDGIEATRTIRVLEKQWGTIPTAETPIVFVSTQSDPSGVVNAYKQGATDYITKPIQAGRIKQIIRRFLIDDPHIEAAADKYMTEHRRNSRRACLRSLTEVFNNRH